MKTKLPWLLAALPLLGAIYAGCGGSGSATTYTDEGANGASSGSVSTGPSSGNGADDATNDGPTSNSGD